MADIIPDGGPENIDACIDVTEIQGDLSSLVDAFSDFSTDECTEKVFKIDMGMVQGVAGYCTVRIRSKEKQNEVAFNVGTLGFKFRDDNKDSSDTNLPPEPYIKLLSKNGQIGIKTICLGEDPCEVDDTDTPREGIYLLNFKLTPYGDVDLKSLPINGDKKIIIEASKDSFGHLDVSYDGILIGVLEMNYEEAKGEIDLEHMTFSTILETSPQVVEDMDASSSMTQSLVSDQEISGNTGCTIIAPIRVSSAHLNYADVVLIATMATGLLLSSSRRKIVENLAKVTSGLIDIVTLNKKSSK